jgi:hypothetical protein
MQILAIPFVAKFIVTFSQSPGLQTHDTFVERSSRRTARQSTVSPGMIVFRMQSTEVFAIGEYGSNFRMALYVMIQDFDSSRERVSSNLV